MTLLDTWKTYNPVTLIVGCFFIAGGLWAIADMFLHPVRTGLGVIFVSVFFVFLPISLGLAIIHNQLRLRKTSK